MKSPTTPHPLLRLWRHAAAHRLAAGMAFATLAFATPAAVLAEEPAPLAFPGAVGFGRFSQGGRGGDVYHVTSLNDSGTGSLRSAVEQTGPRIVVFDVSGVIDLASAVDVDHPYLTIAGQTSANGVTLRGARIKVKAHDVVLRGLRIRPGDGASGQKLRSRDGLSIGSEKRGAARNVIVDHSSFTWSTDENGSNWRASENTTIQFCLFAEGLLAGDLNASLGYITGPGTVNLTFYRNAFFDNRDRNPYFKVVRHAEFINNLAYNWTGGGFVVGESDATVNAINNYYKHGPNSFDRPAFYVKYKDDRSDPSLVFLAGNVDSKFRPDASAGNEWDVAIPRSMGHRGYTLDDIGAHLTSAPAFAGSGIAPMPASEVPAAVLATVGAVTPTRDGIDQRILNQYHAGTGRIVNSQDDVGGYEAIENVAPPADADGDGMPDFWEIRKGLNPEDASDRNDLAPSGYTWIEEYVNSFF